jgi:hypothetical protein
MTVPRRSLEEARRVALAHLPAARPGASQEGMGMENLSDMTPPASLLGFSSMQPTSMVADETGSMTAPGSASPASAGVPLHTPDVGMPAPTGPTTVIDGGESQAYAPWTAAGEDGWHADPQQSHPDAGTAQPRDPASQQFRPWSEL